jgi:peptidyl-prolyl cis-trans isomerase C
VTITDFEVQDYYNKNPDMFTIPKQIKLRVIMVRSPEDQATVDKELAAKKEFADVAIAHSAGDNASKGGEYGTVPVTNLGPKLKGLIENTKIGQETDWITENTTATDTIYLKFHIDDILPAQLQPLDPDLKRTIRRKMMAMKGSIKNDIRKEMSTARTQAKIVIQDKTVAAAYQEYIEKYLKQNGG